MKSTNTLKCLIDDYKNLPSIKFKQEWIHELKTIINPNCVYLDKEMIDEHSYDDWAVGIKWRKQNIKPFSPDIVVKPQCVEDVSKIIKWANKRKIPVTAWGGGSSVTGQPLSIRGGICLDMTDMNKIVSINRESLYVTVEAGVYGDKLEEELNKLGYTLNHSPQSIDRSTVGGWISTRAMGQFSSKYGGIEDLIISLTAVLPNGNIIKTMEVPRGAVGPDFRHIFIGAEGLMGIVTEVSIKIFPVAEFQIFETIKFDLLTDGITSMKRIMHLGVRPFLVRLYDPDEAPYAMVDKSFKKSVMFLGFQGPEPIALAEYKFVIDICLAEGGEIIGSGPTEAWMARRYDYSTIENLLDENGGMAETIEIAHFWDGIIETYYELKKAVAPYSDEVVSHFSHIYPQGTSLYIILLSREENDAIAERKLLKVWDLVMKICLKNGAAISHHHGSGLARTPYISEALGSSMEIFRRIKRELDPNEIMNPKKLIL